MDGSAQIFVGTSLRITKHCVRAIESLHRVGFIHRDIEPANFAVGVFTEDRNQVYLINFGISKFYKKKDGSVRPPRKNAGFCGTVRYASLNSHNNIDLSRRDDLWSLFYSYFEMMIGELPWKSTNGRQPVAEAKRVNTPESLCQWIPEETSGFVQVRICQYETKPNYDAIAKGFDDCLRRMQIGESDKYDWEVDDRKAFHHWTEGCVIGGNK